jgi:hypothetical protein
LGALSVIGCASPPLPTEVEVTREVPVTREVESIREVMVEIEVTRQVEITREVPVTRLIYMGYHQIALSIEKGISSFVPRRSQIPDGARHALTSCG